MRSATVRGTDLFGEPERTATLSQFFTPAWLARRIVERWVPSGVLVLEPNAGRGNFVEPLLARGPVLACEIDPLLCRFLRDRFRRQLDEPDGGFDLLEVDFLTVRPDVYGTTAVPYLAVMNPPYEDGQDVSHIAHALEHTGRVIAVVKSDFEFGAERDRAFWRHACVARRAILVDRPDFGATAETSSGPSRNYVVLEIARVRNAHVGSTTLYYVNEERWRRPNAA